MSNKVFTCNLDRRSGTPLYLQLYENIRLEIRQGKLAPGFSFPSEKALAEIIGITRPTIRQAFKRLQQERLVRISHGIGMFVEEPSQWRVSKKVLGVVLWQGQPEYLKEILASICFHAVSEGYEFKTLNLGDSCLDFNKRVTEESIDGLIVMPTMLRRHLELLAAVSVPKVILEIGERQPGMDCVLVDSHPGIHAGVSELIRLGHREIAYIGALLCDFNNGIKSIHKLAQASDARFRACRRALEDADIEYRREWYHELPMTDEVVDEWLHRQKLDGRLPTAIVAFDDLMARLLLKACQAHGVSVPGDVSLLGFGNILPEAQSGDIATVEFSFKDLAKMAVKRIEERLAHGELADATLVVDSRFKPGRSMAAPNSSHSRLITKTDSLINS